MVRQRVIKKDDVDDSVGDHVRISHESIDDASCTAKVVCKYTAFGLLCFYLLVPVLLYSFPQIVEQIVFMNLQCERSEPASLQNPSSEYNLHGAASFHISCDSEQLGLWHILPANKISNYRDDSAIEMQAIETQLLDARDVVIYHHGNGMTRATGEHTHRTDLYKLLQAEGYHVLAFDYRGYGDSTGWPSEHGLVNDSVCVLKWFRERVSSDVRVSFWGHSLGATISTISAHKVFDECKRDEKACLRIDNLIIEGGYTNIKEAAEESTPAQWFNVIYPGALFQKILKSSLDAYQITMAADESMGKVRCPVLIMHAEDDDAILCKHGDALFKICNDTKQLRKGAKYVKFRSYHQYGHVKIVKAPELADIVRKFLDKVDDSVESIIL